MMGFLSRSIDEYHGNHPSLSTCMIIDLDKAIRTKEIKMKTSPPGIDKS
jgi:hypothetical protein